MNIIRYIDRHIVLFVLFFLAGTSSVWAQTNDGMIAASGVATSALPKDVYIMVNGKPITYFEFNAEYLTLMKNRYYHGRASGEKEAAARKELTDTMINRILLVEDAERRGIKPDETTVKRIIANLDRRGKLEGPGRDKMIKEVTDIEGKKSQVNQLRKLLENVPRPTAEEVRAYYDQHSELFTEPEKLRLSVILVSVDPSSPVSAWQEALERARGIYNQVKNGADFAELARKVSGDKSAAKGGDLGYLHHGMLPRGLEDKVDKFQVGVVVEPIKMLEGMAVFRLEDRIPAEKIPFDRSKARAEELLIRDNQKRAWQENIDQLRKTAKIEMAQDLATDSDKP